MYMGFLDDLLGKDEGEVIQTDQVRVNISFNPLRLESKREGRVNVIISITNPSNEKRLVSVGVFLPHINGIGFDRFCVKKVEEKQLGELQPRQTKEIFVTVMSNGNIKSGFCPIEVVAYTHFQDYGKILNYTRKKVELRVI